MGPTALFLFSPDTCHFAFTGLIASDDLGYYHFARLISRNLYTPALDHYAFRYGLTIPVAMVYFPDR